MKSEHQEAIQKAIRILNSLRRLDWSITQIKHINGAISELEWVLEE